MPLHEVDSRKWNVHLGAYVRHLKRVASKVFKRNAYEKVFRRIFKAFNFIPGKHIFQRVSLTVIAHIFASWNFSFHLLPCFSTLTVCSASIYISPHFCAGAESPGARTHTRPRHYSRDNVIYCAYESYGRNKSYRFLTLQIIIVDIYFFPFVRKWHFWYFIGFTIR